MILRNGIATALVAMGAATTVSAQAYLLGPKGEFTTSFLHDLKYDPSRGCYKPTPPYGDDRYEREAFVQSARRYVDCMERNASTDADYAVAVVNKGYKDAVEEYLTELRRDY